MGKTYRHRGPEQQPGVSRAADRLSPSGRPGATEPSGPGLGLRLASRWLSYCDTSSISPMRMRFARRPPLFRGEKSTKLSPSSADKSLDCAAFRRTTPAARIRPISARRASADMRSGHGGLGPEIGFSDWCDMGTFRDWDDVQKVSRNHENTSISMICGQVRLVRSAAYFCARCPAHEYPPHVVRAANHPALPPMNLSKVSRVGSSSSSAISHRDGARSG